MASVARFDEWGKIFVEKYGSWVRHINGFKNTAETVSMVGNFLVLDGVVFDYYKLGPWSGAKVYKSNSSSIEVFNAIPGTIITTVSGKCFHSLLGDLIYVKDSDKMYIVDLKTGEKLSEPLVPTDSLYFTKKLTFAMRMDIIDSCSVNSLGLLEIKSRGNVYIAEIEPGCKVNRYADHIFYAKSYIYCILHGYAAKRIKLGGPHDVNINILQTYYGEYTSENGVFNVLNTRVEKYYEEIRILDLISKSGSKTKPAIHE